MREQIASLCVFIFVPAVETLVIQPVKFQIHMMYLCRDLCVYLMGIIMCNFKLLPGDEC